MIVRSLVPRLRASGQERLGFGPNSAHEIGRRLGTGERGALARPSRHSLNVVLSQCGLPHRCGQAALGRIGFRSGGLGRVARARVVGLNTAAEPTAKSACQNRCLGFEFGPAGSNRIWRSQTLVGFLTPFYYSASATPKRRRYSPGDSPIVLWNTFRKAPGSS
jgi:hypothetical protein